MSWRACAHRHRECHCHSLTLQKVLRSRLVIGWCRQLASCDLSLGRRGSYGSGALPALVSLMSVFVCVMCVAGGMAWLRYASGTPMCLCVGFTRM